MRRAGRSEGEAIASASQQPVKLLEDIAIKHSDEFLI